MSKLSVTSVVEARPEAEGVTTLRFDMKGRATPGQFVMVWMPRVDEIPMSLSYVDGIKGVTVREVGPATKALVSLKAGDRLGVRGPFGRGFRIKPGRTLVVGGGTGIAAVLPAAERVADRKAVDVVLGARTAGELFFEDRAKGCSGNVRISTDDGSRGLKGSAVELASKMVRRHEYTSVLACGPEAMLASLLPLCSDEGLECQFSLERYMKCAVGLCGSCAIDGRRVCRDGPVFSGVELRKLRDFGRFRRDGAGLRIEM